MHVQIYWLLSLPIIYSIYIYSMCTKSLYYIKCKAIYLLILADISQKYLTIRIIFTNVC